MAAAGRILLPLLLIPLLACGLTTPQPKLRFKDLNADVFRHPLDKESTDLVRSSPLSQAAEQVLRRRILPLLEEGVALDNLANAVKVSEFQLPELHGLLLEAAEILDLDTIPELYVKQNPQPNAYTMAMNGDKPFIVVHSSLLALCDGPETQAVLAHEMGHLKAEHGIWLSLGNLAGAGLGSLPGPLGGVMEGAITRQLQEWQRAAEYTCDRAALLVAQDSQVVSSALLKLVGGGGVGGGGGGGGAGSGEGISVDAFVRQAEQFNEALRKASPAVSRAFGLANAPRTHPLPVLRVSELDRWARGSEFHGIVKRAEQQQQQQQDST